MLWGKGGAAFTSITLQRSNNLQDLCWRQHNLSQHLERKVCSQGLCGVATGSGQTLREHVPAPGCQHPRTSVPHANSHNDCRQRLLSRESECWRTFNRSKAASSRV